MPGIILVIEEFMTGREVSVLCFCRWKDHIKTDDFRSGPQARQRRRSGISIPAVWEHSLRARFYTKEVDEFCKKYIYQPTVDAMAARAESLKGHFLWADAHRQRAESSGIQCQIRRSGGSGGAPRYEK